MDASQTDTTGSVDVIGVIHARCVATTSGCNREGNWTVALLKAPQGFALVGAGSLDKFGRKSMSAKQLVSACQSAGIPIAEGKAAAYKLLNSVGAKGLTANIIGDNPNPLPAKGKGKAGSTFVK